MVTYCLEQVVLNGGTGTLAHFGHQVAGKTGTTSNNTDAWFIGYTPQLTTAVWVGYPTGSTPMTNLYGFKQITGGTLPADIFRRFMAAALSGAPFAHFDQPGSLTGTRGLLGQVPATFPTTTTSSTSTTSTTSTTVKPTTTIPTTTTTQPALPPPPPQ